MSPTTALDALARSLGVDVGVIPLYIASALVTVVIVHLLSTRTSSRGGADAPRATTSAPTSPAFTVHPTTSSSAAVGIIKL